MVFRPQETVENDVDIGIVPSQGLVPPTLCISDLESSEISEAKPNNSYALLATKSSLPQDRTSITQKVRSNVVPKNTF